MHEILLVDKTLRMMITAGADSEALFAYARQSQAMRTLREEATELVLSGVTTTEELLKTAYTEGLDG